MTPLPLPPANRWPYFLLRIALAAVVIYLLTLVNARYLFHTDLYESGESGANSLSVLRAAHGQELYGASSPWRFRQPGPALFYSEALGEAVFYRWLHLTPTPFNAQVLAVIGLLASFFAAGVSMAARWVRGSVFVALALALTALHVTAVDGRLVLLSTWTAFVIPLIFFCLVVATASVGAGQGEDLPLLALAGGFLVHLHVAQPLFVVPMFALAYAGLWWSCWRRSSTQPAPAISLSKEHPAPVVPARTIAPSTLPWRVYGRSHRLVDLIILCFAVPFVVDAVFPSGNIYRIFSHFTGLSLVERPFQTSLGYLLRFAVYDPSQAGASAVFPTAAALMPGHGQTLFLWMAALLSPLVALGVRVWRGKEPTLLGDSSVPTVASAKYASPAGRWRFLGWLGAVWALSIGLTLVWGVVQPGEMFYVNAWFNYAIWLALALFAAGALTDALEALFYRPEPNSLWKIGIVGLFALLSFVALRQQPERFRATDGNGEQDRLRHQTIAARLANEPAGTPRGKLLVFPREGWQVATGIAVQLTRVDRSVHVTPDWEPVFGSTLQLIDWSALIDKPAETNPDFEVWHLIPGRVAGEQAVASGLSVGGGFELVPGGLPMDPAAGGAVVWEGAEANARDYVVDGWLGTEVNTSARQALIQFKAVAVPPEARVRITFDFVMYPFAKPSEQQRIEARYNGNSLGMLTFTRDSSAPQSVIVPAELWNRYGAAMLTLEFPDARVSDAAGESSEDRSFAFNAHKISFALEEAAIPAPPMITQPTPTPAAEPSPSPAPAETPPMTPTPTPVPEPSPTPVPETQPTMPPTPEMLPPMSAAPEEAPVPAPTPKTTPAFAQPPIDTPAPATPTP